MGNCLKKQMPYKNLISLIISDKNKHYFLVPNMVLSYMKDKNNPFGKYIDKHTESGNQIINSSNNTFGIFCYETPTMQPNKYLAHVIFKFKFNTINKNLLNSTNVIVSSKNLYNSDGEIQILQVDKNKSKPYEHILLNALLNYDVMNKIITNWHINLINLYKDLNNVK